MFDGWVNTQETKTSSSVRGLLPRSRRVARSLRLAAVRRERVRWREPAPPPATGEPASFERAPARGARRRWRCDEWQLDGHDHGQLKNPTVAVQTTLARRAVHGEPRGQRDVRRRHRRRSIRSLERPRRQHHGRGRLPIPKAVCRGSRSCTSRAEARVSSELCGLGGLVKGTIDTLEVDVKPTTIDKTREPARLAQSFSVYASAKHMTFATENYSDATVCINRSDDSRCRPNVGRQPARADGPHACEQAKKTGGSCSSSRRIAMSAAASPRPIADVPPQKIGRVAVGRALGGTVALDDLPLAVVEPMIGKGVTGGLVSATFTSAAIATHRRSKSAARST